MAKKIYDIKPPESAEEIDDKLKEFIEVNKIDAKKITKRKRRGKRKKGGRPSWTLILTAVLAVIIIFSIYLFFKLPKAEISIWPNVETLSYEQTVTADKSADLVDLIKNIVPAHSFSASKTNSQVFPATGNASNEGLASGTITIYNKYDPPTPFTFKAGTRFLSDTGKLLLHYKKFQFRRQKNQEEKLFRGR